MGGFANLMLMERFSHKIDFAVFVSAVLAPSGVSLHQDLPLEKLVRRETLNCCILLQQFQFSQQVSRF